MMDRHWAHSIQNDVHLAAEEYLDKPPSYPPEDVAFADCHRCLSIEDVETGATVLACYLGLGSEYDGFADMKAMIQAYYLDPAKRARLVAALE